MKLLGWMHRKFRQNSNEQPLKDFCIGQGYNCLTAQPSMDEQEMFQNKNYGGKRRYRQFSSENQGSGEEYVQGVEGDGEYYDHDDEMSELFHGFLAIGTLGCNPIGTTPSTPTFAISLENITEKESEEEASEKELKLINDELEKVLLADQEIGWNANETSARNSQVSAGGRSSQGSTFTLSGKALIEGRESNAMCPLQEYLFGSAVEIPMVESGCKKEPNTNYNRTSLGELFQRTKMADQEDVNVNVNGGGGKWGHSTREEDRDDRKRNDKEGEKRLAHLHLMKKMLKKKLLHACSRNSNTDHDYGSTETKLHKIKRMFYRKVHPESGLATPRKKVNKSEEKKNSCKKKGHDIINNEAQGGDHDHAMAGDGVGSGTQPNATMEFAMDEFDSNGSRECWIKTDAQYLVLEL